jgi:hypothetical protein
MQGLSTSGSFFTGLACLIYSCCVGQVVLRCSIFDGLPGMGKSVFFLFLALSTKHYALSTFFPILQLSRKLFLLRLRPRPRPILPLLYPLLQKKSKLIDRPVHIPLRLQKHTQPVHQHKNNPLAFIPNFRPLPKKHPRS